MWQIRIRKKYLPEKVRSKIKKDALTTYLLFLKDLETNGPFRNNWPHYGYLDKRNKRLHCHLKKDGKPSGRPTYVVCRQIISENPKIIEVYYAGTHEKAPY